MKLLAYKKALLLRLHLLKASIWFTFQSEVAYAANNWAGLASTTFYTLGMLIFFKIIFSNIKELAGYSYQEMLVFFLLAQVTYFLNWTLSLNSIYGFIVSVNTGNLDLILTKPVPALFYLMTKNINLYGAARDGLPPILVIAAAIKWHEIQIMPLNFLLGVFIMIFGLWVLHVFSLMAALPVFWLGESENILDLALQMSAGSGIMIPLEGFSRSVMIALSSILPVLLPTAFAASALLNKTDPWTLFIWSLGLAILAMGVRSKLWKIAIKNYTSASS